MLCRIPVLRRFVKYESYDLTGNGRFSPTISHTFCAFLDIGIESDRFLACAGVYDPDFDQTNGIIGDGLLATLPITIYSLTFCKTEFRPILIIWTLLVAFGYVLYTIIVTDPNRHYQICPTGFSEYFGRHQEEMKL